MTLQPPRPGGRPTALSAALALALGIAATDMAPPRLLPGDSRPGRILPGPCQAFLPGALTPTEQAQLVRAGAGGVAPERAFRLETDPVGAPTRWNLLVVLVDFPDLPGNRSAGGPAFWQRRIFGPDAQPQSLADYYRENSGGRLDIRGLVTSWVRLESPASFYLSEGAGNIGGGVDPAAYPHNSQRLVEEAVTRLGDTYRWADFDNNGDGLVDGLLVVAAGLGAEETAPLSDPANRVKLLAHQFHASFEVPVPGARVFDYAIVAADARPGVVAHEVGHLLGLIDLYQVGAFNSAAGPFGLGDWSLMGTGALLAKGEQPAQLDAWSKARLNFVTPERVTGTRTDIRIVPASMGGAVLRLGLGAGPGEYFLVEVRARSGADAALPGQGLLVYHVFEASQTNSSASRYKVALVQADARNDLGRVGGNRGDAGDPYPGDASGDGQLTESTTPSSRNYDGGDSGARLTNIRWDGPGMLLSAVQLGTPGPRLTRLTLRELAGDGDGLVEAGERASLDVTVHNAGAATPVDDLELALTTPDSRLRWEQSAAPLGRLGSDEVREFTDIFRFRLAPDFPEAETLVPLDRVFAFSECSGCPETRQMGPLALFLGGPNPFRDDLESGDGAWAHEAILPGGRDPWHPSTTDPHSGQTAWFCGAEGERVYDRGLDAGLTLRPIRVPPRGRLVFWQRVRAESLSTDRAWDGGRVEGQCIDSDWRPLTPVEDYPFTLETGSGNRLFGSRVFSGKRGWRRVVVDLSNHAGATIRLRWRFASDLFDGPPTVGPDGWWIDDVSLDPGPPRTAPSAELSPTGGVSIRWDAPADAPFRYWRVARRRPGPDAALETVIRVPALPGGGREVHDNPAAGSWIYRLDAEDDDGVVASAETARPLRVPVAGPRTEILGIFPRPFRPTGPALNVDIRTPAGAGSTTGTIDVFDVQGRSVARLPWTSEPGTVYRLQWDGRGAYGTLRSGVYWMRLRWSSGGGGEETGVSQRFVVVT